MNRALAKKSTSALALVALPFALAFGCGGDDDTWKPPDSAAPKQAAAPQPGGAPAPSAADAGAADPAAKPADVADLPQRQFTENDFNETEKNRDPFRSYASMFASQAKGRTVIQRQVVIDRYALDELKLAGVVTRTEARALFIDPGNVGWVVKVGDYVGKAEIVHTGGPAGADVAINWRVDRIRDGDVVFVRDDPAHPEIAPVTRTIALFPTEQDGQTPRR